MPSPPLPPELRALIVRQDGVVTRRQAAEAGLAPHDVVRLVRRREWARVRPGIFVTHTGSPTWSQRAWAAVLDHWPAALYGASVLHAVESGADQRGGQIHVAIDRSRGRPAPVAGVRVHWVADLQSRVSWHTAPPRLPYEDAVLDLAAGARDDLAAVATVTAACAGRRTTPERLRTALSGRHRLRRRGLLLDVLRDAEQGTCSVLEHAYLARVERAHGLPTARRQARHVGRSGVVYRDVEYAGGAVVELDGRAHHTGPGDREADLDRDLRHAAAGGATVRLGYRQVLGDACTTAALVADFLRARGVRVAATSCGTECLLGTPTS